MSAAVALAAGWTDPQPNPDVSWSNSASGGSITSTATFGNATTTYASTWWPYPWGCYRPYYVPVTTYVGSEKVRLKSSEVDRLRTAAKRDAKLKAVLEKLTPCIEVEIEL